MCSYTIGECYRRAHLSQRLSQYTLFTYSSRCSDGASLYWFMVLIFPLDQPLCHIVLISFTRRGKKLAGIADGDWGIDMSNDIVPLDV